MMQEKHRNLVLAFMRILYTNGQDTEQTLAAAKRLADVLGLQATVSLRWGELQLQSEENGRPIWQVMANPVGVDMNRVVAAMRVIDDVETGRLAPDAALEAIDTIARSPPNAIWLLSLAAGAGAVALSVIFGAQHLMDAVIIFVIAGAGAGLRRALGRLSANAFVQPFCASLLAGVLAAVAFRFQLISSLRLVALCPCVVLIPGSHMLNGLMDLIKARIHLGSARLIYAGLVIAAITTGLLLGLVLFGLTLPIDKTDRVVPLWQVAIAAGVATAAFGSLFSIPPGLLLWPVVVGTLAHALRWAVLAMGFSTGAGTLGASFAIGLTLMPLARRQRVPFAGIGFVSIVSMIPGSYLFTMASGLVQIARDEDTTLELIGATIANGTTAMIIILAICVGLVVPKLTMDYLDERRPRQRARSIARAGNGIRSPGGD
jgi:uncharacterized membrane protein YjjP (DUF1212 family)